MRPLTWLVPVCSFEAAALAQEAPLTLERALAHARNRAPSVLAAQGRIEEARGRLKGASLPVSENPVIEAARGSRQGGGGPDWELGLSQDLDTLGRRRARIAGARAAVDREIAAADDVRRRLLREVAASFFKAVHGQQRLQIARASQEATARLLKAAERRFASGDIAALEVNLARSAHGRASAEILAAEAAQQSALGELRTALGMRAGAPLSVAGDLKVAVPEDKNALLARAADRADLRALAADLREAEADWRLASRSAWPTVGLGVRYEQDDGDRIVWGGVRVSLPIFNRGQAGKAVAAARASRLRTEIEFTRRAIEVELASAFEAARLRRAAVAQFERDVLPGLDDNDALSARSYEAGQIGLPELLLIRRDALDGRAAYLDLALEAALAEVDLLSRAGGL